jgi:hypothetical protein
MDGITAAQSLRIVLIFWTGWVLFYYRIALLALVPDELDSRRRLHHSWFKVEVFRADALDAENIAIVGKSWEM